MNRHLSLSVEFEEHRMRANHEELVHRIMRAIPEDGSIQPLEGIFLTRASIPLRRIHSVVKPSFCVIAQGSKEVLLGAQRYLYGPNHYFLATLELPRVSQVLEASRECPYLSFRLELDPALVGSVLIETNQLFTAGASHTDVQAMVTSPLDANMLDAVVRLIRLADAPAEATVMMPLITREIIYRLLMGQQGDRLSHIAAMNGYTSLIARAIDRLREDLCRPLRMEDLAHELGISVSGLAHRFKTVTAMSPLQFQKQLRLQEARRLMLSENLDAASTAYQLGYHDPAHFSREYKSLFGVPPMSDIQQLRERTLIGADQRS
jgi:AraC-like DNA-binding protein